MLPTIILRHRRENLKKCSLTGLETHPALHFLTYPTSALPNLSNYIVLKVGAPPLTVADASKGLFLIDATWRLAGVMAKVMPEGLEERSLPLGFKTAYPRRNTDCLDPTAGLSSIEALYIAHRLLNKPHNDLLNRYHWKEQFFHLNHLSLMIEDHERPIFCT
jgi:pre-rRNA-processing protein TSR3